MARGYNVLGKSLVLAGASFLSGSLESRVYASDSTTKIPVQAKSTEKSESLILEQLTNRLNYHRRIASVSDVELNKEFSEWCKAHSKYLVINGLNSLTTNLNGVHNEDPSLPGYTEEGKKVAPYSNIYYDEPSLAIDQAMSSFFHRIPLLDPRLKTIGIGYTKKEWVWTSVVYCAPFIGIPENKIIAYPANEQKDVPVEYIPEIPNPIPMEDEDGKAGFPITLTFFDYKYPKEIKASLQKVFEKITEKNLGKSKNKKETRKKETKSEIIKEDLPFWLSSPEKPADKDYQGPTICLIPKDPLERNSLYEVTVTGTLNEKPWNKTWRFTTVGNDEKLERVQSK